MSGSANPLAWPTAAEFNGLFVRIAIEGRLVKGHENHFGSMSVSPVLYHSRPVQNGLRKDRYGGHGRARFHAANQSRCDGDYAPGLVARDAQRDGVSRGQ